MKRIIVRISFSALTVLFSGVTWAQQDENVEVVIATGIDMEQCSAISPNNAYAAMGLRNTVSIWDLNTGRMIRNVYYSDDLNVTADSLWFTDDNKKVVVGLIMSNDTYEVDIVSGEFEKVTGEPIDYTKFKYQMNTRLKLSTQLNVPNIGPFVFSSPDGKKQIIYKQVKNNLLNENQMPFAYEKSLKLGDDEPFVIDTVTNTGFTFSPDSKYILTDRETYDLESGRLISELRVVPFSSYSVAFLPGTHIPVTAAVGAVRVWSFPEVKNITADHYIHRFIISDDGNYLICRLVDFETKDVFFLGLDLKKGKVIGKPLGRSSMVGQMMDVDAQKGLFCFSNSVQRSATDFQRDYTNYVYDINKNKVLHEIPNTVKCYLLPEENKVFIDSFGIGNFKYDLLTKEMTPFPTDGITRATGIQNISRKHLYLMGSESDYVNGRYEVLSKVWDAKTGALIFKKNVVGEIISAQDVLDDKKLLAFASSHKNTIHVYDLNTGEEITKLNGHVGLVTELEFSDDGKRLLSGSEDGTRRLWNLEDPHEMVKLINTSPTDYAIVSPAQYYYATKGAKKVIHFVKGATIYPFQQFDLKYNRPDIILENLEASNQELIKPFYYAYKKRLKRLGYTEEMLDGSFHMPEVDVAGLENIPFSTPNRKLTIEINAKDPRFKLDRLIVRVNEVPLNGKKGMSIAEKSTHEFVDQISVDLSQGSNLVEVAVMNEKGVESIASSFSIDYVPKEKNKPNLYLFAIGVSEYEQADFNLNYAAKDAKDIAGLFQSQSTPFNKVIVQQITNEDATVDRLKSIKDDLNKTTVDDAVCLFFAGHGVLDVNFDYFLASHNINFKDPAKNGIPYELMEEIMDGIPARKKLIMIDACHSGEIDKEEVAMVEETETQEPDADLSFRSVSSTTLQRVGLNNSFELMKELFTDIRKASGTVIISSAGGMEYAMEGGEWQNGVFTYSFLKGIKNKEADLNQDGEILLSEMNTYIRKKVFELTNGRQQPTNRAEVVTSDWRIW